MAATITWCNSFKQELLQGQHALGTDVIRVALYTSAATLSAATTAYSATNEVVGTGYVANSATLTATVGSSGGTAYFGFADYTWANSTITARYALIYNFTKSKAIAVITLDTIDVVSSSGNFTLDFPVTDSANALFRF